MKITTLFLLIITITAILASCGTNPPHDATNPIQTTVAAGSNQTTTAPPQTTIAPPQDTDPPEVALTQSDFGTFDGKITAQVTLLGNLANDGDFGKAQGSCTDGTYVYIILENTNVTEPGGYAENSHYSKIFKIDPTTLETVAVSDALLIDHGNDITYNPSTGMLIVSNNTPNYRSLSVVNAETLALVEIIEDNELRMYGIAYNPNTDKYVVGISGCYDFAILSNDLQVEQTYEGTNTFATKQGIACDDNYIYFLQYKDNLIVVYDWEGSFIRKIAIKGIVNEPEGIFILNGKFYVTTYYGSNAGAQIFELDFIGK